MDQIYFVNFPLMSQLFNNTVVQTLCKLEWLPWVTLWNSMRFIRRSKAPG